MGTVRWDLSNSGKNRGLGAATTFGQFHASGSHTSSELSASNITDGAAGAGSAVTAALGQILHITCDEAAWVVIGGGTAVASTGFYLEPNLPRDIEITTPGTVSVIDDA